MSETEKIETTSSERMDVDSNVENVENTVASSEKMDVEEVDTEVEKEHLIVSSSSESGVQNIENTETVEEERPSSGENTETAEKMDVEEAEKEEDGCSSLRPRTLELRISRSRKSQTKNKAKFMWTRGCTTRGNTETWREFEHREVVKRLSNGVVVNTRDPKSHEMEPLGNTTSRVH